MATVLLSRKQVFSVPSRQWHQPVSKAPLVEWFDGWNNAGQCQLLAELAAISHERRGWILMLNTPAPLSRRLLADAGVDPALVIDMGNKVEQQQLLLRAMAYKSIAAVVCWQWRQPAGQQQLLEQAAQRHHSRVFLVATGSEEPALH
ncbi:hypothetical protein CGX12_01500 [Zobellella denitrificans]|uniref:hypothetical protein n=1 Tax=Zobellella denitrificans TaxID=347534 RepID=UPI000B8C55B0|nr:hypothetical protein [Zobellella denitrificans]OXS16927.1 hypothetical protein CGX12_01500 [Zobellella denitrificans]